MSGFIGQRAHVRLCKQEERKEAGVTCFMIDVMSCNVIKALDKGSDSPFLVVKKFAVVFCILLLS